MIVVVVIWLFTITQTQQTVSKWVNFSVCKLYLNKAGWQRKERNEGREGGREERGRDGEKKEGEVGYGGQNHYFGW